MKRNIAAVINILMVFGLLSSAAALDKAKDIQFRRVLTADEVKSVLNDKYSFVAKSGDKPKEVFVDKKVLLSSADIAKILVVKKADNPTKPVPMLDIAFTDTGAKKLEQVTTENKTKELAIVVGTELFSTPYIVYPLKKGHFLMSNWKLDTDEKAADFVKEIGFTPVYQESGKK